MSLPHLNELTRNHPNIPRYIEACAHTHHKLGSMLRKFGSDLETDRATNLSEAERYLKFAVQLQQSQCDQFPESVAERTWLTRMQDNLARCLLASNQPQAALAVIDESIAGSNEATVSDEGQLLLIHVLVGQFSTRADILDELDRKKDAEAARQNADDLRALLPRRPRRPP